MFAWMLGKTWKILPGVENLMKPIVKKQAKVFFPDEKIAFLEKKILTTTLLYKNDLISY